MFNPDALERNLKSKFSNFFTDMTRQYEQGRIISVNRTSKKCSIKLPNKQTITNIDFPITFGKGFNFIIVPKVKTNCYFMFKDNQTREGVIIACEEYEAIEMNLNKVTLNANKSTIQSDNVDFSCEKLTSFIFNALLSGDYMDLYFKEAEMVYDRLNITSPLLNIVDRIEIDQFGNENKIQTINFGDDVPALKTNEVESVLNDMNDVLKKIADTIDGIKVVSHAIDPSTTSVKAQLLKQDITKIKDKLSDIKSKKIIGGFE